MSTNNECVRACLVCVFKNWKLLFKKICGNTCVWKSMLKYVKYCLKTENDCLKTQTKHPLNAFKKFSIRDRGLLPVEVYRHKR